MTVTHVRIQESDNLIRDISSKAVLNTDRAGLQNYLVQRELAKKQMQEKAETSNRLIQLEQDMNEIKSLLRQLAKGNN
jgi:hypothetical protein